MTTRHKTDPQRGACLLPTPAAPLFRCILEEWRPALFNSLILLGLGFTLAIPSLTPLLPPSLPSRSPGRFAAGVPGEADNAALLEKHCLGCHLKEKLQRYNKTEEQWDRTIVNMVNGYGAKVSEQEKTILARYMATHFGSQKLKGESSP